MEEILRTLLYEVRGYARKVGNMSVVASELRRDNYLFGSYSQQSIRAALESQQKAGISGSILQGESGNYMLPKTSYGYNPSLSERYRYSVLVTCTNTEGGPDFKWLDVVTSPVPLSAGMLATQVDVDTKNWQRGELTFGLSPGHPEVYSTCSTEVLYAERRNR